MLGLGDFQKALDFDSRDFKCEAISSIKSDFNLGPSKNGIVTFNDELELINNDS